VHVRFCEGVGVRLPRATHLIMTGSSPELLEHEVQPLVVQFLGERGLEVSPTTPPSPPLRTALISWASISANMLGNC
jgi:hypothetical protein